MASDIGIFGPLPPRWEGESLELPPVPPKCCCCCCCCLCCWRTAMILASWRKKECIQQQQQFLGHSFCSYVHNCRGLHPNPHFIFTLQERGTTNSTLLFVPLCCSTLTQILSLINIEFIWKKKTVCQSASFNK